jgi:hypothetical protein
MMPNKQRQGVQLFVAERVAQDDFAHAANERGFPHPSLCCCLDRFFH